MINSVALTGRLTKDIELKYTPSGIPVGSFTLAINRKFTKENGEREADFINCVVWRKTAETMSNHLKKGSLIGVEGNLQSRTYEDRNGNTVFITEVNIEHFIFLEAKQEETKQNFRQYGGDKNDSNRRENNSRGLQDY